MKRLYNIGLGLLLALTSLGAGGAEPKRVLFIHSFGRGFEPYHTIAGLIRTELASQMAEPVDFFEASLESARFTNLEQESPLLGYLQAQFAGHHLDLVVPVGGPAAQFVQRHRQQLFPETPMLAAVDQRLFNPTNQTANDAAALTVNEPGQTVEMLLHVLPETINVVVVMGNSAIERFWFSEPGLASRPNRRSTYSISVLVDAKAKQHPAIVATQENASVLANRQALA